MWSLHPTITTGSQHPGHPEYHPGPSGLSFSDVTYLTTVTTEQLEAPHPACSATVRVTTGFGQVPGETLVSLQTLKKLQCCSRRAICWLRCIICSFLALFFCIFTCRERRWRFPTGPLRCVFALRHPYAWCLERRTQHLCQKGLTASGLGTRLMDSPTTELFAVPCSPLTGPGVVHGRASASLGPRRHFHPTSLGMSTWMPRATGLTEAGRGSRDVRRCKV